MLNGVGGGRQSAIGRHLFGMCGLLGAGRQNSGGGLMPATPGAGDAASRW